MAARSHALALPSAQPFTGPIGFSAAGHTAPAAPVWSLAEFVGRLGELSGLETNATLTLAFRLVLDAQHRGEPVAWITTAAHSFFPPDVAQAGVDLRALAVVRVPEGQDVARAADMLARSAAFGLIVLDLHPAVCPLRPAQRAQHHREQHHREQHHREQPRAGRDAAWIPPALQTRLLGLAQKHRIAILCLTHKPERAPSLSSLVSLRAQAVRSAERDGWFACTAQVHKDKRRAPGWQHREVCRGPVGLR